MGAGLALGTALGDSVIGLLGNHFQNQANQQLAQQQANWNRENQEAQNAFNLEMWHRANQYNSPIEQMARFKEAGLNPNLIYGKGTAGNTTPLQSADIKPYDRAEARSVTDGLQTFGKYHQFNQLQAQTDNTKAGTDVQLQQAALIANKNLDQIRRNNLGMATYNSDVQKAQANAELATANARRAGVDANVWEATEQTRIDRIKQDYENAKKDGDIKEQIKSMNDFEIELNKKGLTKQDSKFWRMMAQVFDGEDLERWIQNFMKNSGLNMLKLPQIPW